jgi:ELWxxDGT repeat protein
MNKFLFVSGFFMSINILLHAQSFVEPTLLRDINPSGSSRVSELTVVGQDVFFFASDSANNTKLWKSDGSPEGTVLIKEINPGPVGDWGVGLLNNSTSILSLRDTAYFFAFREDLGHELWKSAGHDTNTVLVKDINPGSQSPFPNGNLSPQYNPFIFQGYYYFVAFRPDLGYELWRSDGSESGTIPVTNISGNSPSIFLKQPEVIGDRIFFCINSSNAIPQLGFYATDGTPGAEIQFSNLYPSGVIPMKANYFMELGNWIYFPAGTTEDEPELYRVSQDLNTVELFYDFNGEDNDGSPREFFPVSDGFVFRVRNGSIGEPSNLAFSCDGTVEGTTALNNENGEPIAAEGTALQRGEWLGWNNMVLFADEDQVIWCGNGQQNGSIRLGLYGTIEGIENTGTTKTSAVFGNRIVFQMDDTLNNELIIISDGTAGNTYPILDHERWTLWEQMVLKGDTLFVVLEDESDNGVGMELYALQLNELPTFIETQKYLHASEKHLFPNPSAGKVSLPNAAKNAQAVIRNSQGRIVEYALIDEQGTIEISPSNASGIYFVNWLDATTNLENHARLVYCPN